MSESNSNGRPREGMWRWLPAAAIVSLSVNLFIAGALFANWSMRPHWIDGLGGSGDFTAVHLEAGMRPHGPLGGMGGMGGMGQPGELLRFAEPAHRKELHSQLQANMEKLQPHKQAARKARRHMVEMMSAETFSEEDLKAALTDLRVAQGNVAEAMDAAILDLVANLTPEERARMAEGARGMHEMMGEHRGNFTRLRPNHMR